MKKIALLSTLAALAVGCAAWNVPTTNISGNISNGKFNLKAPKDSEITGLHIVYTNFVANGTTNAGTTITIDSYKAKMNPQVIVATGDTIVKTIQSGGQALGQVAGEAAKAVAK